MAKWLISISLMILLLGCVDKPDAKPHGANPPDVTVQVGDRTFATKLGTYCWGRCVDMVGAAQLLEGREPIRVNPNQEVSLTMAYEPKPNQFHLMQESGSGQTEIPLSGNTFKAPALPGLYYYTYSVWWMDEHRANVSNGDASYVFALEVAGD